MTNKLWYEKIDKEDLYIRKTIQDLAQFDDIKRQDEDYRRWETITKERLQALAENKPLPIRPMSIELSKCLKD